MSCVCVDNDGRSVLAAELCFFCWLNCFQSMQECLKWKLWKWTNWPPFFLTPWSSRPPGSGECQAALEMVKIKVWTSHTSLILTYFITNWPGSNYSLNPGAFSTGLHPKCPPKMFVCPFCVCMCVPRRGSPAGRLCPVGITCHGAESLIDASCFSGGAITAPKCQELISDSVMWTHGPQDELTWQLSLPFGQQMWGVSRGGARNFFWSGSAFVVCSKQKKLMMKIGVRCNGENKADHKSSVVGRLGPHSGRVESELALQQDEPQH